ncbi:hypothetical protein [Coraliomargarita parva]|uniref:hypothetical protein n=1 Tax=Coraliomargarita parva TaxID=3014050 RepID=UPI0022B3796D|nr:hypothetical protein [Coraliomargarita parva]
MNKRSLIALSLVMHFLLFFTGGITIEKTIPIMMVGESGNASDEDNKEGARDLMAVLKASQIESSKENGTPVLVQSMHQFGDNTYVVRYNFMVITLVLVSAIYHFYSLRKLKFQQEEVSNG